MNEDLNKYYPYEEENVRKENEVKKDLVNSDNDGVYSDSQNSDSEKTEESNVNFTLLDNEENKEPVRDNSSYESNTEHNNKGKRRGGGGGKRFIAASLIGAILGGVITGGGIIAYLQMNKGTSILQGGFTSQQVELLPKNPNAVSAVATKAGPSVVGINVTAVKTDFFFGPQSQEGSGSGIIIKEEGYILTNHHVIKEALDSTGKQMNNAKVEVVLSNSDKAYPAKIVGHDAKTDLAVLKIEANNLPAITIGDSSKLHVGDDVIAIGNPGGIELMGSVTAGVVSGLNRTLGTETREIKLIQTDASINPGNSGGALVNIKGELVGVNSSKIVNEGFECIGFAIPSNDAKRISESLIENKYVKGRPYLGISVNPDYTKEIAKQYGYPEGVLIAQVQPFSGASNAGLKPNDIITKFNGVIVKNLGELDQAKSKLKPGDTVKVEYFRDKNTSTVDLTLTEENNTIQN